MNLVIFGASGGTGRELVRQALAQGHHVTAFVRNPRSLTSQGPVRVVVGDSTDAQPVANAIIGQDAVLSALGARSLGDRTLLPESMKQILPAMKLNGVRRLIVLGAAGVDPGAGRNLSAPARLMMKLVGATILKNPFASQRAMQELIRRSDREWTIVQPPKLLNTEGRGIWRVDADALPPGAVRIARADVAAFMLAQLSSTEWVRKAPFVAW
jgi:putative NADH-flavin reductase